MDAVEDLFEQVFVPNDTGVITAVISSPMKRISQQCNASQSSQVINPSQSSTNIVLEVQARHTKGAEHAAAAQGG